MRPYGNKFTFASAETLRNWTLNVQVRFVYFSIGLPAPECSHRGGGGKFPTINGKLKSVFYFYIIVFYCVGLFIGQRIHERGILQ